MGDVMLAEMSRARWILAAAGLFGVLSLTVFLVMRLPELVGSGDASSSDAATSGFPDPVAWGGVDWVPVDDPFAPLQRPLLRFDGVVDGGDRIIGWGRIPRAGNQFGDAGAVFLSVDGRDWSAVPILDGFPPTSASEIVGVAVNSTGYLAYGGVCCDRETRAVWHSPDGVTWTRLNVAGDVDISGVWFTKVLGVGAHWVAFGGGIDGNDGSIWTSDDGATYESALEVPGGVPGSTISDAVATADGLVAVGTVTGADGTYDGAVWRSGDGGRSWERLAAADESLVGEGETRIDRAMAYAGGLLLVGIHGSSEDRAQCEQVGMAGPVLVHAPMGARSCGWGTDQIWVSTSGEAWERIDVARIPGEHPIEFRIAAAGGPGLLVFGESSAPASPDTKLFATVDGRRWSVVGPLQPMLDGMALAMLVRDRGLVTVTETFDGQQSTLHVCLGRAS